MTLLKWAHRKQPVAMAEDTCFSNGTRVSELLSQVLPGALGEAKILNHHGLLSLRVVIGGATYKVAECDSEARAVMAEQALRLVNQHQGPAPEFIARQGTVIIARWEEGQLCSELPPARQRELLLQCQADLNRIRVPASLGIESRYIHLESLSRRLRSESRGVLSRERTERILFALWKQLPEPEGQRVHLIHPDLTPVNVVLTGRGPVIIDNEVIGLGLGREFDVWHSAEALYGHREGRAMADYASAYDRLCPGSTLFSHQPLWDQWRQLRRGLKAVQKRRYIKAARLLWQLQVDQAGSSGD